MTGITFFGVVTGTLMAGYVLFILINTISWIRIPTFNFTNAPNKTKISIIIAMRNEENNIISCLQAISNQIYPHALYEIIVVNDHSTDQSAHLVNQFAKSQRSSLNIKLIDLNEGNFENSYKKIAISAGIKVATGELIVTTDADCQAGSNWLACIASYYEKHHPVLMMCPVSFNTNSTLFSKMQALEFAGLIGMGASSNFARFPLMCNGANLAYTKKAFDEINGFGNAPAIASGDDTFLLFKMQEKYNDGIHFIKSVDAEVITNSEKNAGSFFKQRKRWASKTTKYNKPYITNTGLLIYFSNATLFIFAIFVFFNIDLSDFFILLFIIKILFEFSFMWFICSFFKKKNLLWSFLPTALLFIPYIVVVGLVAPFGRYEWKGRMVK